MNATVSLRELENGFETPEEWMVCWDRETGKVVEIDDGTMRAADDAEEEELTDKEVEQRGDVFVEHLPLAREIVRDVKNERFVQLPSSWDFHEYRRMEEFVEALPAGEAQERLWRAISRKGAFRRFKDEADRVGVLEGWYDFRQEALRNLLRDWAEQTGITVVE